MNYFSINSQGNRYEKDFYLWISKTAKKLKNQDFQAVDLPNLIEELESPDKREKRELKSRSITLLMHLIKWYYQPEKRGESWRSTITEQRICIKELLEDSPSLKPLLTEVFTDCYQKACLKASDETGIAINVFPAESPFSFEEALTVNINQYHLK